MATIDATSPRPRRRPLKEKRGRSELTFIKREYLPIPRTHIRADLFSVLEHRRTRRRFSRLGTDDLSAFLWHCLRTKGAWTDEHGLRREWRPAPSAGATHPHEVLVIRRVSERWQTAIYNPNSHALDYFDFARPRLAELVLAIGRALPIDGATVIWLIGRRARTERYYKNPDSLIWRDAGVLVGIMALVAEGLTLSFCPLGITGEPYISNIFGSRAGIQGYGGALIGHRRRQTGSSLGKKSS